MTDFVWPNGVRMTSVSWRPISNAEVSPRSQTGGVQTAARPGDRLGCTIRVANSRGIERALLRSLASSLRGAANRIYLQDLSATGRRRGSFPSVESLANSDFASATGWTAFLGTLTISDGVGRFAFDGTFTGSPQLYQVATFTPYAPYVLRVLSAAGRGLSGLSLGPRIDTGSTFLANNLSTSRGYLLASGVPRDAGGYFYAMIANSNSSSDDYLLFPFVSASRCGLVDGGGSSLLQSDTFQTTWTPTNCTVGTNSATLAPDGTSTADWIIESNSSNVEHNVAQSYAVTSAAQDVTFSASVHASTRSWAVLRMVENAGGQEARAWINLSTGALGTVAATSGNWTNVRAHVVAQGNGWYRVSVTAYKTNAATAVECRVTSATADASASYAGSATTVAILMWRACSSAGSVPTRGAQTTTLAVAAATQQSNGIYVKGFPASTNGVLKKGDQVEIDKQLKILDADLNTDAAGLGYLQVDSPFARALADNTPVIVEKPMAKFFLSNALEYENEAGDLSQFQFEFEQDLG